MGTVRGLDDEVQVSGGAVSKRVQLARLYHQHVSGRQLDPMPQGELLESTPRRLRLVP